MIEAMYAVEFMSNLNKIGQGVVIFETDRIFGGDSGFTYIGKYEIKDKTLYIEAKIKEYGNLNNENVIGLNEYTLIAQASIENYESITLKGYAKEDQSKLVLINLKRIEELP